MKTAMQEAIDYLREFNLEASAIILEDKFLEKEKEQIVQAFKTGYNVTEYDADDYFDLLYNQNK